MLRRDTLTELGGAQTIVQSHLDAVMAGLSPQQVQVAAAVFYHLITASGSKIALTAEDLADWADVPSDRVHDLLEALSSGPRRILRPVPPATGAEGPPGYEIFHDVMQGPCKVSFARSDLRFWRQRPESCLLSHHCALDCMVSTQLLPRSEQPGG